MRRGGFSLLELMVATAIMATLMTSLVVIVRSGYAVWNAQESDISVAENAHAVLRHFVREMRQATSVTVISAPASTTGNLSFTTSAGVTREWSYSGGQVLFNNGTSTQLLAPSINELNFIGYEADGTTTTTIVDEIQVVKCMVKVTMTQGGGTTRTESCRAWIRSW
ncbi:MAG: prepilin-type N-terminal cleavage/methylation domain-containing protein [Pirellulales bacterium]